MHNFSPSSEELLEYSVVYTERALNHMAKRFGVVMRNISSLCKEVYAADAVVIVPGGGSFGMEAVARQFAQGKKCLSLRNGLFNFRWSEIFRLGKIPHDEMVLKAQSINEQGVTRYAPADIHQVVEFINKNGIELVFATHVETSAGIILTDDYIRKTADAIHAVGGLMVLDCIASGAVWVDMKKLGVDILISAPQKGWAGTPCAGLIMFSEKALGVLDNTESDSFCLDIKKWRQIMHAYENGSHAYHATMPTDALCTLSEVMNEAKAIGFETLRQKQWQIGEKTHKLLQEKGFASIAASTHQSPSVIVCYTDDPQIKTGQKFAENGIQIAAGVPLQCDEPAPFSTFRIGLFGLDKLMHIDRTIERLANGLNKIAKP